jgi:NADPH2:quinone reductase
MAPALPQRMKAVALERFGGPEVLGLQALPVPHCDEDEVLIRVDAAGVAVWDRFEREGELAD